jgi:hypothetical protein
MFISSSLLKCMLYVGPCDYTAIVLVFSMFLRRYRCIVTARHRNLPSRFGGDCIVGIVPPMSQL